MPLLIHVLSSDVRQDSNVEMENAFKMQLTIVIWSNVLMVMFVKVVYVFQKLLLNVKLKESNAPIQDLMKELAQQDNI